MPHEIGESKTNKKLVESLRDNTNAFEDASSLASKFATLPRTADGNFFADARLDSDGENEAWKRFLALKLRKKMSMFKEKTYFLTIKNEKSEAQHRLLFPDSCGVHLRTCLWHDARHAPLLAISAWCRRLLFRSSTPTVRPREGGNHAVRNASC